MHSEAEAEGEGEGRQYEFISVSVCACLSTFEATGGSCMTYINAVYVCLKKW